MNDLRATCLRPPSHVHQRPRVWFGIGAMPAISSFQTTLTVVQAMPRLLSQVAAIRDGEH